MIRQVFRTKFPHINYVKNGIIDGHGLTSSVSKKLIIPKRFYSAGSSSLGKKLKKVVYTTGAFIIGTGGLVLYAKNDTDFQAWLNDNIPGYSTFEKFTSKEKNLFQVYVSDPVLNFKDTVLERTTDFIGRKETDTSPVKPKDSTVEAVKKDAYSTSHPVQQPESSLPSARIVELEKVIASAAQDCVQSYNNLTNVVTDYSESVQRLIDRSFKEIDSRTWTDIRIKQQHKQELFYIAEAKIDAAMKLIDKLKILLQDSTLPTSSEAKQRVVKNMNHTIDDVLKLKKKLQSEINSLNIADKFWKDVQEARKYFFEELDDLISNKGPYDTKLLLTDDELNLFLMYAYQKIAYYQRELSRIQGSKENQMNDVLSKLKEKDEIIDATIQVELDKYRRRLQEEFEKKELSLLLEAKRRTRGQVKLQAEAYYDLLREATSIKEEEMKRKFQCELEDKIDELKTEGRVNIAGMVGRLKGYNDAITKCLFEKKQARAAQDLWCACQTLRSAVELPHSNQALIEELKPLEKDVNNIIDNSGGDEFVKTVASTIPKVALVRGVYPKMTLKDRFLKVQQVALGLAQVDESGLSIPKLFISWIQSFLIIQNIDPISGNEIANDPIDTSSFSTYDILHRAKYWMDLDDILQAVRYMNLLTGAPKAVAKEWIEEATILLETLQAADTLLAHACAGSFSTTS